LDVAAHHLDHIDAGKQLLQKGLRDGHPLIFTDPAQCGSWRCQSDRFQWTITLKRRPQ
jgi:hypothetical protein